MPYKPPIFRALPLRPSKRPEVNDPYYHTPAWRRLRAYVLERDHYRCTQPDCQTPDRGHGGKLIAGHIIARTDHGPDHPSNVRTFCPTCDARWHVEKGHLGQAAIR